VHVIVNVCVVRQGWYTSAPTLLWSLSNATWTYCALVDVSPLPCVSHRVILLSFPVSFAVLHVISAPQPSRLVTSIAFPFVRICFRNLCPHCRSVASLPFPYRDANGYGKNRTQSYLNGWTGNGKLTETDNVTFYLGYGILPEFLRINVILTYFWNETARYGYGWTET